MLLSRAACVTGIVCLLFLTGVQGAHEKGFDRVAAAALIDARLEEDKAWGERYALLSKRKKAGEDVDAEIKALNAARPAFQDLAEIAERIVAADPEDDAAFKAIGVALRGNRIEDMSNWQGSPNEARQARMTRALLDHHLHRPDFLGVVYLSFSDSQDHEYVAFWKAVFERSLNREVRGQAARSLTKHYARRAEAIDLPAKEREALRGEVRHYAQILQRDYADVGQLSQEAEGFLASLQYSAGATLPAVEVATVAGGKDALTNYRGKVVLLDFWATWCGPCKKDHPKLIALKQELVGRPFEIIGVSADENPELVSRYLSKEHNLPWPQWYVGPKGALLKMWGIQGYPTYLLVGADGVVKARGNTQSLSEMLDRARELAVR